MIVVADPDPLWPRRYEAAAAEIARALGPALRAVEHVGSTGVPGLPAKPVIDVMAAVDALEDVPLAALLRLGFEPRVTGMAGRLFRRREADDAPGDALEDALGDAPGEGSGDLPGGDGLAVHSTW